MKGKETCRVLRQIRQQVATDNNIPYASEECKHTGDCLGTCPKCESEVRYLDEEIRRRGLGVKKIIAVTGLSLALSSCDSVGTFFRGPVMGSVPAPESEGQQKEVVSLPDTSEIPVSLPEENPKVVCHYTDFARLEGDVPYENEPTTMMLAKDLMRLIVYPQKMIEAKQEASLKLTFYYDKKGVAHEIVIKDSPDDAFTRAVKEALKKLDKKYAGVVELEKQNYFIPIDFKLK